MEKEKSAYAYLLLTILLWSAAPAVATVALEELSNFQLLFYVNLVGMVVLFSLNLLLGKLPLFREYSKSDFLKMFGMGFLGIFLYYVFIYKSFDLAPAGEANIINYLWPVFVVIFSILLLKEKFNRTTLLAILLSFAGAALVFSKGGAVDVSGEHALGYLLALGAAVSYGLFSVLGKKLPFDKYSGMLAYYVSSFVLVVPAMLLFSGFAVPQSPATIVALLFLGGLASSIAFVFWFKALALGHTHKIANYIYITPFLALVFVYFINGEATPLISILGLFFILGGILLQARNKPAKR
jgi:drug/metabolite transporter (DMT)-like permease